MSSINFTGLSNIKVGSADCTVYLGANKMWPTGISPTFAVVDTISSYTDRTYNWVYDRSTKTWNHLENNSYRALTVPTTTKGIYIVDENYNFVEPSSFSGNADNAIGIAFLNWSRTFTDSNKTVVTNNFIMGAPQINTGTWLTNDKPVDNRRSYLSLPLFEATGGWSTTNPSTSLYGNATGEDETQIVEDAINAGTLENCTMVPYVRKFFNNKNNILKDFPYQLGYVPSAAETCRIMWNTYGTTTSHTSHTAFEKLGYRNFDNDSSVNKTNFVTIDKASSDITYKWPNQAVYMYDPTNNLVNTTGTYGCQNIIPCMNPLLITPPTSIAFNSVEERDAYTEVYNGLVCKVGSDYYEYNNGWKDYSPYVKVDNTIYPGKWLMSDTDSNSKIKTLTVTVESLVECIVYAECNYTTSGTASIVVDGTTAASWEVESQTSGSCTLTPGTHTVTFKGAMYTGAGYREYWSYLNPSKCYIQIKA
jgi:hypothetical protein